MASSALLQGSRLQAGTRRAPAPHRPLHRHAFVRANKDAQLRQMAEYREGLARQLAAASQQSSAEAAPAAAAAEGPKSPDLREINQETFYPTLEAAGSNLVVVDFFTAWCGPCKMIYPELCEMNAKYKAAGVEIVKFECNKANKELGQKLGIKVAPTFHLYKNGTKVADMTGAKVDQLRELIEKHK